MMKRYGVHSPGYQPDGTYIPNEYFMNLAIRFGEECPPAGQHPVGAVVTRIASIFTLEERKYIDYEVVAGIGKNRVENDSSAHAEMVALRNAESYEGRRHLGDGQAVLYTTHEPCPMCAGAIANSKLSTVVYGTGARDASELVATQGIKWRSNLVSGIDVIKGRNENGMNEQTIIGDFMRDECLSLLGKASLINTSLPPHIQ